MADVKITHNIGEFMRGLKLTERQMQAATKDAAVDLGKQAAKLYAQTMSTWNNKADFGTEVDTSTTDTTVTVGTDDKVYFWLDEGTRVRRAILSPDWISKTQPGSLKSGRGRGRVVFISKKVNRPGIKARNFTEGVRDAVDKKAEQTFNRAIKRALR